MRTYNVGVAVGGGADVFVPLPSGAYSETRNITYFDILEELIISLRMTFAY